MSTVQEILKSKDKPKQKLLKLAQEGKKDTKFITDIVNYYEKASDSEKGYCMEALEYISQEKPQEIIVHKEFIINQLEFDAPRVKWEAARTIGNLAKNYSKELEEAIPNLINNTKDKGTVVRWSTAFALSELAKYNEKAQTILKPKLEDLAKKEINNGVKNVYLKGLKDTN